MKADVVFAAFGFNESFAGEAGLPEFRVRLTKYLEDLRSKAYNGEVAPRIVLVSPIPNENVEGVPAADLNNGNLRAYADVMKEVATAMKVGYADVFAPMEDAMSSPGSDLTFNGVHMEEVGYARFGNALFEQVFGKPPPEIDDKLRHAVVEKNRQYFRRFRPVNTFYYVGGRRGRRLGFSPRHGNFKIMTANRDERIHALARGEKFPPLSTTPTSPLCPRLRRVGRQQVDEPRR